jgi:hypothetical protein
MRRIETLVQEGLLEQDGSTIKYSAAGRLRSDSILEYLL